MRLELWTYRSRVRGVDHSITHTYIEEVDVKCWLAEMTLIVNIISLGTSFPMFVLSIATL